MAIIDLSQSEIIILDIHVPGFETVLKLEDINASELPPEKVAKLGTIRLVDKKDVSEMNAIKRSSERACLLKGVRFIGGFIVSSKNAQGLSRDLEGFQNRFHSVTARIAATRDRLIEKWADANPEWRDLIMAGAVRYLARTKDPHFNFTPIQISAAVSKPEALQQAAVMIGSQLMSEIGQDAKEVYEVSFRGKSSCTRRALSPLVRMREKLHAMRFASDEAVSVIYDIDQTLGEVPATGPIEGHAFNALVALILRLKHGDVRQDAHSPYIGKAGIEHLPDLASDSQEMDVPRPATVPAQPTRVKSPTPVRKDNDMDRWSISF